MSEAIVIFNYKNTKTNIACKTSDKMITICEQYVSQVQKDITKLNFIYNGNLINKDLKFEEQINDDIDKLYFSMNIKVEEIKNKILNEIICPECNENILINIKDYKINMSNCKNNHIFENLSFEEFNECQNIDILKIKCNICNESNINEIYKCINCNKNICKLCKINHDINHLLINYEKINLICYKHNDFFTKYCNDCHKNICINCEREHNSHNTIYYGNILPDEYNEDEYNKYNIELKKEINGIIIKLKKILENIEIYNNISKNIIKNKNRNYEILKNKNEIINYNKIIINDIKEIINDNDINNKFKKIIKRYDESNNYIISEINIKREDINKDIRIINSLE